MNDEEKQHWTLDKNIRITEILAIIGLIITLATGWSNIREQMASFQMRQEMFERASERQASEMKSDLGKLIIDLKTELREFRVEYKADIRALKQGQN